MNKSTIRQYLELTKPGIIRGNAIMAIAGFLLASTIDSFNLELMLAMLIGLSLVIASGCTINNIIDKDIDKKMERTKKRALASNHISSKNALIYGILLGIIGCAVLWVFTNLLALVLAILGFIFYVFVYGLAKRKSVHGTIIGSISGAIPPIVGYTAVTDKLDTASLLLFIILVTWQMPHFYAIAMYRIKDYTAAEIPVLPAVKGIEKTKRQIMLYIFAFTIASLSLTAFEYTGAAYALIIGATGLIWFIAGMKNYYEKSTKWAKKMYVFSLLGTMGFLAAILADFIAR